MWVPGASQMPPSTKLCIKIILALLCQGRLCQASVYRIQVPSRVTAQQGLCVLLPCNFTAKFNSSGVAYKYWFLRDDDRDTSPAVATTDPGRAPREPGGRIRLVGNAPDDCSLLISDVRAGDKDRYYFHFVKGDFKYSYQVTQPLVDVTELMEQPVLKVSEVLLSGQLVNVTCQAPGTCSGTPPQITWTGGFNYTARNISVTLANGSISYSSVLSFTPAPEDDGKELVCTVTYPAVVGVCTHRAVRLHVRYPPTLLPQGNCTLQGRDPRGETTCHCAAEAGFSRTLVVASVVAGSLVLVVAGAAVAWKVVKGRQGGRVPARAGRCQGTGDGQVCHSSEQQAYMAPSHR
ncbi:sialic acid-binding Ig-like lectin 13 isoform X2 [Chrysemys picta bellii]|uniref:sialic acid-binding Ig-like lectin 13 isoform X2 n=1 Tax=Chrysemys picta bellii TaxID=8478 RepID=UPI0032B12882